MSKQIVRSLRSLVHFSWVALVFLGLSLGLSLLIDTFASDRLSRWLDSSVGSAVLAFVFYAVIALVVSLPFFVKKLKPAAIAERLGLTKLEPRKMFVWALLSWGLSMVLTAVVVMVLLSLNMPGLDLEEKQDVGFSGITSAWEYIAAFVALVVLAPVFEEIIFRGYLYGRLRENGSVWYSIVMSSLLFAALHFQPNVVVSVFVLSLFLGFLREKFDSIWPGVMLHALKNGLAYALLFILPLYGVSLV